VSVLLRDVASLKSYSGSFRYDVALLRQVDAIAAENAERASLYVSMDDQPKLPGVSVHPGWIFSFDAATMSARAATVGRNPNSNAATEDCTYSEE
jgi:hypothetical protein